MDDVLPIFRKRSFWITFLVLSGALFLLKVFVIDSRNCRVYPYSSGAIGNLKTLASAQALFREGDRDRDGKLDYANSLTELGPSVAGLIDNVFASGTRSGYSFQIYLKSDGQMANRLKSAGLSGAKPIQALRFRSTLWTKSKVGPDGWYAIAVPQSLSFGRRSFAVDESGVVVFGFAQPIPGAWKYELWRTIKKYGPVVGGSLLIGFIGTIGIFGLLWLMRLALVGLRYFFRPHLERITPKPAA